MCFIQRYTPNWIMSLDIEAAIRAGIQRAVQRNGLVLMGIFIVIGIASSVFSSDLIAALMERFLNSSAIPTGPGGPRSFGAESFRSSVLALSLPAAAAGYLLASLTSIVANIAAIRTFVSDETDRIRREFVTRKLLWVGGNLIVGSVVFGLMVAIGFVLLIIPGIFLLVSLYFWNYVVITEDEDFITGLQRSWQLTEGHRFMLFVLGAIVTVAVTLLSGLLGMIGGIVPPPGATIISAAVSAPFGVVSIAIAAEAFGQLRGDKIPAGGEESVAE
jgi:uncharacterized membrane protein (Fun14 family)